MRQKLKVGRLSCGQVSPVWDGWPQQLLDAVLQGLNFPDTLSLETILAALGLAAEAVMAEAQGTACPAPTQGPCPKGSSFGAAAVGAGCSGDSRRCPDCPEPGSSRPQAADSAADRAGWNNPPLPTLTGCEEPTVDATLPELSQQPLHSRCEVQRAAYDSAACWQLIEDCCAQHSKWAREARRGSSEL